MSLLLEIFTNEEVCTPKPLNYQLFWLLRSRNSNIYIERQYNTFHECIFCEQVMTTWHRTCIPAASHQIKVTRWCNFLMMKGIDWWLACTDSPSHYESPFIMNSLLLSFSSSFGFFTFLLAKPDFIQIIPHPWSSLSVEKENVTGWGYKSR